MDGSGVHEASFRGDAKPDGMRATQVERAGAAELIDCVDDRRPTGTRFAAPMIRSL
jgi:hypothetical protein